MVGNGPSSASVLACFSGKEKKSASDVSVLTRLWDLRRSRCSGNADLPIGSSTANQEIGVPRAPCLVPKWIAPP